LTGWTTETAGAADRPGRRCRMPASQSLTPPRTASAAVCGEYTAMLACARRRMASWCGSERVMDLRPRKMKGSAHVGQSVWLVHGNWMTGVVTVGDDDGGLLGDGLLGDAGGQVVGEQDAGGHGAGAGVDVFLEEADVVPGAVGEFLGVAGVFVSDRIGRVSNDTGG